MNVFYVFVTRVLSLYLSTREPTLINFSSRIENCQSSMSKEQYSKYYSRNRMSVTFFLRDKINYQTSIICHLEDGSIKHFDIKYTGTTQHRSIYIDNGDSVKGSVLVYKEKGLRLYEGSKNYYVEVDAKTKINGKAIDGAGFVSKWNPINVNGRIVWLK